MPGFRHFSVALALFAIAGPAAAESGQPEDDYTRPGFYFALGASLTVPLFEDELEDWAGSSVEVDKSVGLNAAMGWRFLPWLAGELHYEGVKGYDVTFSGAPPDFRMDSHTLTANVRVYYPLRILRRLASTTCSD